MGDILFHLTRDEEALLVRHTLQLPLTEAEIAEAKLLQELHIINDIYAKVDTQKSVDGYGVEDRSKT